MPSDRAKGGVVDGEQKTGRDLSRLSSSEADPRSFSGGGAQKKMTSTRVSRGDRSGNPANFKGTFCSYGFNVETYHHVTMTLHSLFQSKMADGADFLNGDDL